jgi:nucleotide-binding universal stress UspA family protein
MSNAILVGFDPHRIDRAPVEFAATLARLTGARLIIASVENRAPVVPLGGEQWISYAVVDSDLPHDCSDALSDIEEELRVVGVPVECWKRNSSSAAKALQEAAEESGAAVLVVGSTRSPKAERLLAGSTAERLLAGAPCPVAVVPLEWSRERGLNTVGVAFVNTPEGQEALRAGHMLARRLNATLRVLAVVETGYRKYAEAEPTRAERVEKRDPEDVEGDARARAEEDVRRAVASVDGDLPVEVDAFVDEDPADVLVRLSKSLDLLVCGSRGYGPLRAVLLGSVSRRLTAQAGCPVVVLPRGVHDSLEEMLAEAPGAAASA